VLFLLGFVTACASPAANQHALPQLVPISRAQLCVTKGAIDESGGSRLEVTVPEMRAVVTYPTEPVGEAKLIYLGPTSKDKPLRSGEIRRQFGLKLRAQNGCNLIYAVWRIEPKQELVVSVKLNPGKATNAECGTNGYHNIKPTRDLKPPQLVPGETHTLRAELEGSKLEVRIDGKLSWEGILDRDALALQGPSGVRTDNGRFKFELLSSQPVMGRNNPPCHAAEGDE
jgi:hypothetical protein